MSAEKPLFSHHIFLFPFRWDVLPADKSIEDVSFNDRTDFDSLKNSLGSNWRPTLEKELHDTDRALFYNTASYFYEFAREAVFEREKSKGLSIVRNFHFKADESKELLYRIFLKGSGDNDGEIFNLHVDDITLNVYSTGVAIIAFSLSNYEQSEWHKILKINDFGRRVFPQFLKINSIEVAQLTSLAEKIWIGYDGESQSIFEEDFKTFNDLKLIDRKKPDRLPNVPASISKFLGDGFCTDLSENRQQKRILIDAILDDRMFVVCWFGLGEADSTPKTTIAEVGDTHKYEIVEIHEAVEEGGVGFLEEEVDNDDRIIDQEKIEKLEKRNGVFDWIEEKSRYGFQDFEISDFWLRFIFIDTDSNSSQSRIQRPELASKHTNHRWVDWKSLYGVSRYSFVCLTDRNDFALDYISVHVKNQYLELSQMVLAQRASLLRFSSEVTAISSHSDEKQIVAEMPFLYQKYLQFVNQLYFREATPQEQGIEFYRMLHENMEIQRDVDKLDQEISELHQLVDMLEQAKSNQTAQQLTWIATFFLPASLIASLLGLSLIDKDSFSFSGGPPHPLFWGAFFYIIGIPFLGAFALFIIRKFIKKKKKS